MMVQNGSDIKGLSYLGDYHISAGGHKEAILG